MAAPGTRLRMKLAFALLYPIALLLPAAEAVESVPEESGPAGRDAAVPNPAAPTQLWPPPFQPTMSPDWPLATATLRHAEPEPGWQVRIEQRMQIRITPHGSPPRRPEMFVGIPEPDFEVRFTERKIGKCLSIASIAGVQPEKGTRLLLYTRDRRIVAAELERSCRARDFYSGFYLSRTEDGQLCVDRDTLLTRSGMNCKLTRIRQLVESER